MEPDFSGWATKAGLKCSDGRTILPGAFKHQDKMKVPLVWQHGHSDVENVLGHAILEARDEGVYTHGYFNKSEKASHAKGLLTHGDINRLSIWANELIEKSGRVLHGTIREVSLVLSGANPGAVIESITIQHDGIDDVLEDQAIIHTGLEIVQGDGEDEKKDEQKNEGNSDDNSDDKSDEKSDEKSDKKEDAFTHADGLKSGDGQTIADVYNSMTDAQKEVLHYMLGQALSSSDDSVQQSDLDDSKDSKKTDEEGSQMKHNVFEQKDDDKKSDRIVLSHEDVKGIVADATKKGSLKEAVEEYALAHGITDIDLLFPDAVALDKVPEFLARRTEWVNTFLSATRKSPFSRIKSLSADITVDEARAKGYITGSLKKEEFFRIAKRETTPTTVYKKQKLDRDDIVDITDFDIVAWLKSEMRIMLDEEVARAALMGDGRDISDDDKINEQNIRPIATDHELFVTTLTVNLGDANSSISEFIDIIISNRSKYKGTGNPVMYTKESVIAKFLLLQDTLGRKIYRTLDEVAAVLRVSAIVPVEVMEEDDELLAILVNPADYVYGATRGGEVSLFDDFDIDYNQYKYLIETRLCGCLTKLKSAIVIRQSASGDVAVVPNAPTFDEDTGVVTIVATTHVVYKNADTDATLSTGAQAALDPGETLAVRAVPDSGYYVDDDETYWTFTRF